MAQQVRNLPTIQETQEMLVRSLGREDPLEEENGNLVQYSCLKKNPGQRSLAGYSPWGCKDLDTTEPKDTHRESSSYFFFLIVPGAQQSDNIVE